MRRVLPLVLLGLLLGGCADWIVDPVEFGEIDVEVASRSGEPVPGAVVILFTPGRRMAVGVTGDGGNHSFDFVVPGRYAVRAVAPAGFFWPGMFTSEGAQNVVEGIQVEEGARETVAFTLLKAGSGSVEVTVTEADGTPVVGATVHLVGLSREFDETLATGAEGTALFEPVGIGHYLARLEVPAGFETAEGNEVAETDGILVDRGFRATVAFELRRIS